MSGTPSTQDVGCSKNEKARLRYQENKADRQAVERERYWKTRERRLSRAKAYYWENRATVLPKAIAYARRVRGSIPRVTKPKTSKQIIAKPKRIPNPKRIYLEQILIGRLLRIRINHIRTRIIETVKERRRRYFNTWKTTHPDSYKRHQANRTFRKRNLKLKSSPEEYAAANQLIGQWRTASDFVCNYCKETFPISKLHVDHYIPVAKGGKHSVDNIKQSCPTCNLEKKDKTGPKCWFMQNFRWWMQSPTEADVAI